MLPLSARFGAVSPSFWAPVGLSELKERVPAASDDITSSNMSDRVKSGADIFGSKGSITDVGLGGRSGTRAPACSSNALLVSGSPGSSRAR